MLEERVTPAPYTWRVHLTDAEREALTGELGMLMALGIFDADPSEGRDRSPHVFGLYRLLAEDRTEIVDLGGTT